MHSAPALLSHVCQGNKTCTICQKVCSSMQALKVHIREQHMDDPALQCDQCNYTAGDSHGLNVHKWSQLPPESRYKCDQCHKSYSQKWHLKQHQQEHQGRFGPCPTAGLPSCRSLDLQHMFRDVHLRKVDLLKRNISVRSAGEGTAKKRS